MSNDGINGGEYTREQRRNARIYELLCGRAKRQRAQRRITIALWVLAGLATIGLGVLLWVTM